VAGCCEHVDECTGSGATDLVRRVQCDGKAVRVCTVRRIFANLSCVALRREGKIEKA
jgi:hypothetical protein